MDRMPKEKRSYLMSQIKGRDTKMEVCLRKLLWKKGARGFRVKSKLKENPDIYFPAKKLAIFTDGCFWHKCPQCFKRPQSNNAYWDKKFEKTFERDARYTKQLEDRGIRVIRFWEHQMLDNPEKCVEKIISRLKR